MYTTKILRLPHTCIFPIGVEPQHHIPLSLQRIVRVPPLEKGYAIRGQFRQQQYFHHPSVENITVYAASKAVNAKGHFRTNHEGRCPPLRAGQQHHGRRTGGAFAGIRALVWLPSGHSRQPQPPHHPQANGENGYPRCTFKTEMTDRYDFIALLDVQRRFTSWQHIYNHERPHQALGMATPAERYSRFKQN